MNYLLSLCFVLSLAFAQRPEIWLEPVGGDVQLSVRNHGDTDMSVPTSLSFGKGIDLKLTRTGSREHVMPQLIEGDTELHLQRLEPGETVQIRIPLRDETLNHYLLSPGRYLVRERVVINGETRPVYTVLDIE